MDCIFVRWLKLIWRSTGVIVINKAREYRYERYWREHKICRGLENKDKTFYIIRRKELYVGLFSFYIVFVNSVKKALDKGYIPIIDMQNSYNIYLREQEVGHINAWETFFEQPMRVNLECIKYSRNIIVGDGTVRDMFPYKDIAWLLNDRGEISVYRDIAKKYFRLSQYAQEEVEKAYNQLIGQNDRVLGVLCRGSDYTSIRPKEHAIQPTLKQMFEKTDAVIKEYNCNKIFLGTEDKEIYMAFFNRYGKKVITNRKDFVKYNGEFSLGKLIKEQVSDVRREGLIYLVTMIILSKCNCFIGGHCSGTVGVMLMEETFEYKYIFDLGIYE